MSFKLVFCSDGILRVNKSISEPMVPLKFFQEQGSDSDLRFMSRWWEEQVVFENGITIGDFLSCISPWSDFWTDFIGKDVGAYIKESRRPCEVKPDHNDWYAFLGYYIEAEPDTKSNKSMDDFEDINDFFNDPTPPELLPYWTINGHYHLSGYKIGEDESYSIDHTPINEMAHWPLILSPYHIFTVSEFMIDKYGDKKTKLLNKKALGLNTIVADLGGSKKYQYQYIVGQKSHNLRDIVEAFFWWFASTPANRDAFNESLKNMVGELPVNNDNTSNKQAPDGNDSTDDPEKKLKVVVSEGAFDGIINSVRADDEYFADILKSAKKTPKVMIKIGALKAQQLIEPRIHKWIVSSEVLSGLLDNE